MRMRRAVSRPPSRLSTRPPAHRLGDHRAHGRGHLRVIIRETVSGDMTDSNSVNRQIPPSYSMARRILNDEQRTFSSSFAPCGIQGLLHYAAATSSAARLLVACRARGVYTYFDTVPFNVTLVTSALGNQAFQSFLNQISGGADSFVMALDSGLGVKDHQCQINSDINIDTSDGINWTISFCAAGRAHRHSGRNMPDR